MSFFLITSAAYIEHELRAEFGLIPPSFLPVGNKRLFTIQSEWLGNKNIYLTLPESFMVPEKDNELLSEMNINVVRVPDGLSLGNSIVFSLNIISLPDQELKILHGDTLIKDLPLEQNDIVTVHHMKTTYHWATYNKKNNGDIVFLDMDDLKDMPESNEDVISGYFSFKSSRRLVQAITRSHGNFIQGLNQYSDKSKLNICSNAGEWLDFGHLQNYYRSRWWLTTQREFNEILSEKHSIIKISNDSKKMDAEAFWYKKLPDHLKVYAPIFMGEIQLNNKSGYRISNEYLSTLSDLYIFGRLNRQTWSRIFDACEEFISECANVNVDPDIKHRIMSLYKEKPLTRIAKFCSENNIDISKKWIINGKTVPDLNAIVLTLIDLISIPAKNHLGLMHGDLCFSNIFFDFRRNTIKVIDPRGHLEGGEPENMGDLRYDIAKLSHSVIGCYDLIIAGYYDLKMCSDYHIDFKVHKDDKIQTVINDFKQRQVLDIQISSKENYAATALLFFSMLPLHSDNAERQLALLSSGLELYCEIEENYL